MNMQNLKPNTGVQTKGEKNNSNKNKYTFLAFEPTPGKRHLMKMTIVQVDQLVHLLLIYIVNIISHWIYLTSTTDVLSKCWQDTCYLVSVEVRMRSPRRSTVHQKYFIWTRRSKFTVAILKFLSHLVCEGNAPIVRKDKSGSTWQTNMCSFHFCLSSHSAVHPRYWNKGN